MRKLYRSKSNRYIAGVLGGFGEYTRLDPTVVRVIYVLFTIVTAIIPGIVAYVIFIFIIPEEPGGRVYEHRSDGVGGNPFRPWR